MSLISPFFLDTVVALGVPDSSGSTQFTATGFLYGYPTRKNEKGTQYFNVFLVPNRHVIENGKELWVRFNGPIGVSSKSYKLPIKSSTEATHWTLHPDTDIDVAVLVTDSISK